MPGNFPIDAIQPLAIGPGHCRGRGIVGLRTSLYSWCRQSEIERTPLLTPGQAKVHVSRSDSHTHVLSIWDGSTNSGQSMWNTPPGKPPPLNTLLAATVTDEYFP